MPVVNVPGNFFQVLDNMLPMMSDFNNDGRLGDVRSDLLSYIVRISPDGIFLVSLLTADFLFPVTTTTHVLSPSLTMIPLLVVWKHQLLGMILLRFLPGQHFHVRMVLINIYIQ